MTMGIMSLILLVPTLWFIRGLLYREAFDALMREEEVVRKEYYADLREIDTDMEIFCEQEEWGGMTREGEFVNLLKRRAQCNKRISRMEKHIVHLDAVERRYKHPLFGIVVF